MTKQEAEAVFDTVKQRGLSGWIEQAVLSNSNGWVVCVQQKHNAQGKITSITPRHLMTVEQAATFLAEDIVKVKQ